MLVRDIMSDRVVSIGDDATLRDAVMAMLRAEIGSVVVERDGTPTGICTETDALATAATEDEPLSAVPLSKATSDDLVTGSPDMPVRKAIRRMNRHDIKKLPIVADFDVVGILTLTDVVRHQSDLLHEVHEIESGQSQWRDD